LILLISGLIISIDNVSAATSVKVSSVSITNLTTNYTILLKNETFIAKTKILPLKAANKALRWSSSDPSVASVNSKGIVTAKKGGLCEISATTKDGSKMKVSFFVKVATEKESICDGTWITDYGNFNTGLSLTQNGDYHLTDIEAGNPIHYGTYQIDTGARTISFDGTTDELMMVKETWSYSFPSVNEMLLNNGKLNITYTRSKKTMNSKYLCNKQGLLYSNRNKKSIAITGYIGTASTVTVPSTINGKSVISISGFSGNMTIKKIVLPNSITEISSYAFKDCTNLKVVVLSDQVTSLLEGAFQGCSSLTDITLPDTLEVIEPSVFAGCSSLTTVTIPDHVTILFNHTFLDCSSLKTLILPEGILTIESDVLEGCEKVTIIGHNGTASEFAKINNFDFLER
jgi:hypothetical protein